MHAVALAALVIADTVSWLPRLGITWLDLDNQLGAPNQPKAAPRPPRPAAKKAEPPAPKPKPRPRRREPQAHDPIAREERRDAGVAPSDAGPASAPSAGGFSTDRVALTELAPGDAALLLLLRMDRIHRSPYEGAVRRLLQVFYDHKTLFWSSGLDPITDLDGLLIATPNPYRVTETFLAARYRVPYAQMKSSLERAGRFKEKRMRWTRQSDGALRGEIPSPPRLAQDQRVVLLRPGLVLFTDARHLPLLAARAPGTGDAGAGPSWSSRLDLLGAQGGSGASGPGLLLQIVNLPRLVVLPSTLPAPTNLQVTVPATEPSRIEAVLSFAREAQARAFLAALPQQIEGAKQHRVVRFLNLVSVLDGLRLARKTTTVTATAPVQGDQVRLILELFRMAIPQVKVPGMPDRVPPDAAVRPRDAGVPPASAPARDAATGDSRRTNATSASPTKADTAPVR